MTENEESAYERGERAVWSSLLRQALVQLGMTGQTVERLVAEREQAISQLRSLCEVHGDNEWSENDHLADIIDKHLKRHLDAKED